MKIEIDLNAEYSEPSILIRAKELTPEINALITTLKSPLAHALLIGYLEEQAHLIQPADLIRIYSDQKKVFAETDHQTYRLRYRLYEIEERVSQPNLL